MINSAPPTTTTTTTIPTTVQSNLTTLSIESIPWFRNDYDEIIDCGVRTLFNTISISIIDNRIYQFNMDLSVTIYDQSSKRLNDDRNYCNLTTGRKFFLQNLNPNFIDMNIELENLINFLPKTNSLLHNYFGIALRQEINPTNIRFDVFIKNMTNINDNGTNQYEYSSHSSITNDIESLSNMMNKYLTTNSSMNDDDYNLIMINAQSNTFIIIIDKQYNQFYFRLFLIKHTTFILKGNICLLSTSKRLSLEEQSCPNDDDIIEHSQYNDNDKKFTQIQYGFITTTTLYLISYNEHFTIAIDNRILTIFDQSFSYRILDTLKFFCCQEQAEKPSDDFPYHDDENEPKFNIEIMILLVIGFFSIILSASFLIYYFVVYKRQNNGNNSTSSANRFIWHKITSTMLKTSPSTYNKFDPYLKSRYGSGGSGFQASPSPSSSPSSSIIKSSSSLANSSSNSSMDRPNSMRRSSYRQKSSRRSPPSSSSYRQSSMNRYSTSRLPTGGGSGRRNRKPRYKK